MIHMPSSKPSLPDLQSSGDLIADRRFSYALALLQDKDGQAAQDLFTQVLERVPNWPPALLGMGDACLLLEDSGEAARFFQRCLEHDPSDRLGAGPRLARMDHAKADDAIRPGYIAALFDDYAKRFDAHLVSHLDYTAPQQLLDALLKQRPRFEKVYDLGCGTGLMGAVLRPFAGHLAGCDLSRAMLHEAKAKGIYDQLFCDDCTHALAQEKPASLDLITAADVLVYMGGLTPLFQAAQQALKPDGLFAFTTQACEGERFRIGEDLRSAHSAIYLHTEAQAAGFVLLSCNAVSVRKDRDQAVKGWLCLLRKEAKR